MMETHRTAARAVLLVGIALVVLNALLVIAFYGPDGLRAGPFSEPAGGALPPIVGLGASLFGLWRMLRVWRGWR